MRKLEVIFVLLAIAGVAMKLLFIPLAGFIMTISFIGLAIIYFISVPNSKFESPSAFYEKEAISEIKPVEIFGLRLFGWGLSIVLIGILFCIQFWPNARFFLVLGLLSLLVALIVAVKEIRNSNPILYTKIIQRIVVIGVIGLLLFMTRPITIFAIFHRDNPALVESARKSWENPTNKELRDDFNKQRKLANTPK